MGQVGAAGDNAAMESFVALLQKNVLDRRRWNSRQEIRIAMITWINGPTTADDARIHLGRLTPSSTRQR